MLSNNYQHYSYGNHKYAAAAPKQHHAAKGGASNANRRFGNDISNQQPAAGGGGKGKASKFQAQQQKPAQFRPAAPVPRKAADASSQLVGGMSNLTLNSSAAVFDIDAADRKNPLAVTEYVNDIFDHFRSVEHKGMPSPNYMTKQPHINEKMRAILIDWLVEVHLKFKLMPETLYLTVNLIDRFLERKVVARQRLQLVGVTCMLLASKYEEIYYPEVRDFVYITDRAYTRTQILQMESLILNTLGFELTVPTASKFVKRFVKAAKTDQTTQQLAHYFCERTQQEYSMLKFRPSIIAASCVMLALKATKQQTWTPTLERYTRYKASDLGAVSERIKGFIVGKSSLQAVKKKYTSSKFFRVALIPTSSNMA